MKTAWFDENILPKAMINAKFSKLEESEHFSSLCECFSKIKDSSSIIDLGCGAGEVGRVFTNFSYVGADLPHIINKVAKIKNPNNKYLTFDAENNSLDFLKDYDVVLMNSFLSEIPNWYLILSKILSNSKKYIILHRQKISNTKTSFTEYNTYGNLKTLSCIINYKDLLKIFEMNGFEKIHEQNSFENNQEQKTFLFRKNDD